MHKIVTVVGARPQFIKASALSSAIENCADLTEVLVHSGQHYDQNMSEVFFKGISISKPNYNLEVGSNSHAKQTAIIMQGFEEILDIENPHYVVVFGDTNTTLAAALVCSKRAVKLVHVEAGLRSRNNLMPEEINRRLTDAVSDRLYVPSLSAAANLEMEGIDSDKVVHSGDINLDVLLANKAKISQKSQMQLPDTYLLLTLHRAENVDNESQLKKIIAVLELVAKSLHIVCPLHPRTLKMLKLFNLLERWSNCVRNIAPTGYIEMLALEQKSSVILTDSGGVQKEAFFLQVPCRTLRSETEWTELIEMGWNKLVNPQDPKAAALDILSGIGIKGLPGTPYGDGNACNVIIQDLLDNA
jgi:UDP-GlcNAc3NAcA epimerase